MATPIRVLIVEDRPAHFESVLDLLRRSGFAPDWQQAETEEEFSGLLDQPLDLIIAGCALPQFDAARALRLVHGRGLSIPFLVMDDTPGVETETEWLERGAAGYLPGSRLAGLGEAVRRALHLVETEDRRGPTWYVPEEPEGSYRYAARPASKAIISADGRGNIVSWSRGAGAVFGYGEEEVMGRPLAALIAEIPTAERQPRTLAPGTDGLSRLIGRTAEFHGLRKDGSEFPLELSLTSWKIGEESYYSGIVREITWRRVRRDVGAESSWGLEAPLQFATILSRPTSFEENCGGVVEGLGRLFEAGLVTLRVHEEEPRGLRLIARAAQGSFGNWEPPELVGYRSLYGEAFRQGKLVVVDDYGSRPYLDPARVALGIRSEVFMPIKAAGRSVGLVNLLSKEAGRFTPSGVRVLADVGHGLGELFENARMRDERAGRVAGAHGPRGLLLDSIPMAVAVLAGPRRLISSPTTRFSRLLGRGRCPSKEEQSVSSSDRLPSMSSSRAACPAGRFRPRRSSGSPPPAAGSGRTECRWPACWGGRMLLLSWTT